MMMKPEEYAKLLAVFQKVAAEKGEDLFRVRIMRRNHAGDLGTQWATMREARLDHFASPETWLSKLAGGGGGHFSILVAHDKAPGVTLGELMLQFPGTETKPQRDALARGDWDGPTIADFLSGEQSPTQVVPRLLSPGATTPAVQVPGRSLADHALADENRILKERLDRNERQAELDRIERRHAQDLETLRREVAAAQAPRGPDPMFQLLLEHGKQQAEMFREISKQQREDAQRAEERSIKMIEGIAKKPEDPMMNALIKSHFDDTGRNMKQFENMASLTNLLMSGAMQMMTHQVEMTKQLNPATEDGGPFVRLAEKIADAAIASKSNVDTTVKQLAQGEPQPVATTAQVDPDDAKEAWEAVVESIHEKKPAHEIVPALLVAFHGDPLKGLMAKHHGDISDVVEEVFKAWVLESPADRLKYVQTELVKVEMSLVALQVVRPSKALKQHLNELAEAQRSAATPPPNGVVGNQQQQPAPGVAKPPPPPPPPVQEAGKPFKKLKPPKNGTQATPPAEEAAPVEAKPEPQPVTA